MKPAVERRVLSAIADGRKQLDELEGLVRLALARDDQPSEDGIDDPVHRQVERLVKVLFASTYGIHVAHVSGSHLAATAHRVVRREQTVPNCTACDRPALPRPKRGLCGACYMAFRRADTDDVGTFCAQVRAGNTV